jgi:hypothetical protein
MRKLPTEHNWHVLKGVIEAMLDGLVPLLLLPLLLERPHQQRHLPSMMRRAVWQLSQERVPVILLKVEMAY